MACPALQYTIIQIESEMGVHVFREDMGAVKNAFMVESGADTAGAIPYEQGMFQEAVQAVILFLLWAFLPDRRKPSQLFFFGGLSDLGGRT
jgi:hypothetical protein